MHLQGCSVGMTGMLLCWGHIDIMSTVGCWHHTEMLLERRCVSRNVVGGMGMLCWGHRAVTSAGGITHRCCWKGGAFAGMFCWEYGDVV